ncbi:hypothetical protein AB2T85_07310 [Clostridium butyricum]|uniref:hypothetical protein n=1 Tax=Clostridium butyricum TaxID=1492 RepID=UPI003466A082
MAKKRYKSILATGLAVAGAVQMGMTTDANAMETVHGFFKDKTVVDIKSEDVMAETNSKLDSTRTFYTVKGKSEKPSPDWNKEIVLDYAGSTNDTFYRVTQEDGTPYTGLYLSKNSENGAAMEWLVLDENGCLRRNPMKPQFAWLNGYYSADFLNNGIGPNHDPSTNNWYLTDITTVQGAELKYIVFNKWQGYGGVWYRSNAEGVCYKNQWFQDTDGKWYYFNDKCQMVTNTLVNGYWIGSDGVWVQ